VFDAVKDIVAAWAPAARNMAIAVTIKTPGGLAALCISDRGTNDVEVGGWGFIG
jgi:hypothetical protein